MHPDDVRLLREVKEAKDGRKVFSQREGQPYEAFELEVLRLLELREQRLITMRPDPIRSS